MQPPVVIDRAAKRGIHRLEDVVPGLFERAIVMEYAAAVGLERLRTEAMIDVVDDASWPHVSDETGHIRMPVKYLRETDPLVLYLDMVHELVHVVQFMQDMVLYHADIEYVDWPTEIVAYQHTIDEGRRLGLDEAWLRDYLEVPWADAHGMKRLCAACGL